MTSLALRRVLAGVAVHGVVLAVGLASLEAYASAWLPVLGSVIDILLPSGFGRGSLGFADNAAGRLILLTAVAGPATTMLGDAVPEGAMVQAATLQMYLLHHVTIIVPILAVWPVRRLATRLYMLAWATLAVTVSTLLDVPFVLAGLLQGALLDHYDPARAWSDPLVLYGSFAHRGGRFGIAVCAALVVAFASSPLHKPVRH